MARPQAVTDFLNAAEDMKDSMQELHAAWERLDQDPALRDATVNILSNEYPFKLSFDEQVLAVMDWLHDLNDNL